MLKHVTYLGAMALSLSLTAQANAQDVTANTVVATVGDTEITLGEMIIARTQLPPQYAQFPNNVLFDGLVDQLIQQQLLADAFDGDEPPRITLALKNERRSMLAGEVISGLAESAVTEADIQAAYDERFSTADQVPEYKAAHLLVETEEEATAAKTRIDEGIAFADVARDVSTGPTGPNGGDLGWFGPGAMVPEFEEVITALDVGAVSDPFETQFGWHVAMLTETRVQPLPTLEEASPQITSELQEAAVTQKLEELAAGAEVVKPEADAFDVNLLDRFDLLER